jgi:hypothetical protein
MCLNVAPRHKVIRNTFSTRFYGIDTNIKINVTVTDISEIANNG